MEAAVKRYPRLTNFPAGTGILILLVGLIGIVPILVWLFFRFSSGSIVHARLTMIATSFLAGFVYALLL